MIFLKSSIGSAPPRCVPLMKNAGVEPRPWKKNFDTSAASAATRFLHSSLSMSSFILVTSRFASRATGLLLDRRGLLAVVLLLERVECLGVLLVRRLELRDALFQLGVAAACEEGEHQGALHHALHVIPAGADRRPRPCARRARLRT